MHWWLATVAALVLAYALYKTRPQSIIIVPVVKEKLTMDYDPKYSGSFENTYLNTTMDKYKDAAGYTPEDIRLNNVLYQSHAGLGGSV
jgi:hypothetical protein